VNGRGGGGVWWTVGEEGGAVGGLEAAVGVGDDAVGLSEGPRPHPWRGPGAPRHGGGAGGGRYNPLRVLTPPKTTGTPVVWLGASAAKELEGGHGIGPVHG